MMYEHSAPLWGTCEKLHAIIRQRHPAYYTVYSIQSLAIENDFHSFCHVGGGAVAVERLMTAPNSRHAHGYLCGYDYGYGYGDRLG